MHSLPLVFALLLLFLLACATPALANEEEAKAVAAFRAEAQSCKASPTQPDIGFELKPVAGKSASEEPATPAELARVKHLLAKSNLPFDTVNHRTSFEFTLALVRAKRVAAFKTSEVDPKHSAKVQQCLTRFAADIGLESRFE